MFSRRLHNLRESLTCFRTTTKALVFESDDWGLDKISSQEAFDDLTARGAIDPDNPFYKSGRETVIDMDMLYDVLAQFRDQDGRSPVFTTNFILANPDYEAIERSGYGEYSWIAIDDVNRKPSQAPLLPKYKEGIERRLIYPQYHGRDHFSTEAWLRAISEGDPVTLAGLSRHVVLMDRCRPLPGEYSEVGPDGLRGLPRASIDRKTEAGTRIFERTFGFRSWTSIAPFYLWCDAVEASLHQHGVRCMQAAGHRVLPDNQANTPNSGRGILGGQSPTGMAYLVRNSRFEPSQDGEAAIADCLSRIASAFAAGYPAVIDTHRINYVGVIDPAMRDANLRALRTLLNEILRWFPDVCFLTSEELARSVLLDNHNDGAAADTRPTVPRASFTRRVSFAALERAAWWRDKRRSASS